MSSIAVGSLSAEIAQQVEGSDLEITGEHMGTRYETDVVAWANEQAHLIRAGRFDLLDLKHIAGR